MKKSPIKLSQLTSLSLFFVLIGCSTSLKKPLTEAELLAQARSTPLNAYRVAMSLRKVDAAKACLTFKELSEQMDFFLKEEARIRAYEICNEPLPLINTDSWPVEIATSLEPFLNRIQLSKVPSLDATFQIGNLKLALQAFEDKRSKLNFVEEALKKCEAGNEKCRAEVERLLFDMDPIRDLALRDSQPLKYVEALREQRRFGEATDLLLKLIRDKKTNPEDKSAAFQKLRQIYKVSERRKQYLDVSVEFHNWAKGFWKLNKRDTLSAKIYVDSVLVAARTLWTEDQLNAGREMLIENTRLLKGLSSLDEVYFVLARMSEELKEYDKALSYYDLVDHEPLTSLAKRTKYDWSKAWLQIKLKIFDQAVVSLGDLSSKAKEPFEKFRAQFWQAYAYEKLNEKEKAKALLGQIASEDILGYYGMLSNYKLGLELTPLKSQGSQLSFDDQTPLELRKAKMLIEVQDDEFSKVYLSNFKKSSRFADFEIQTYLLYAKNQQYMAFFGALNSSSMETKRKILDQHPSLVFPTDFIESINEQAKVQGIDPALVFSIIRQESSFNPNDRSPAEAYGLMQLIPGTAKKNAKKMKLPWQGVEKLFEPDYNIKLGTSELASLYKRFGNVIQLASCYNAAESAVNKWLKTRYNEDSLIFIEDIPYDETRTYVKLILRNMIFYKRLLVTTPFKIEAKLFDLSPGH